jgi:predicted deacylase
VKVGEPIGTVTDVLGDRVVTVTSALSGIVLVLTTFPSVKEGDALAVVAELS